MHYVNPRIRKKKCIQEDKLVAIHRFTICLDFGRTVLIFKDLSYSFWQKSHQKLKTDSMCRSPSFLFFSKITNFQRQKS